MNPDTAKPRQAAGRLGLLVLSVACVQSAVAGPEKVAPVVAARAEAFGLGEVQLLPGPFQHAQDKSREYLLRLEPERLLAWFRKEAGLPPKGEAYGGWEQRGVAGHSLGHYLSGCALMYRATGDPRFKERVEAVVAGLAECQQANGDGYVGAIPRGKAIFAEVARGEIRSQGFDLNGGWVPWYTQHKVLAGLRDAFVLGGNPQAAKVFYKLCDWVEAVTRGLDEAQWQRMLACEHGGMNEVLADAYALSGERRYLDLARKFHHRAVLDPLAAGRDELMGKHANTQIPKLIGAARLYALTGDPAYGTMARFFWETVTRHHSYVIGGNSEREHFGPPDKLNDRLSDQTAETCNTYNMLKLTGALFDLDPQARRADFAERALWNHILASQNPEDGMVCYFLPLAAGSQKSFMTPFDSFTCCTGTGMENHARYGEALYARSGTDTLYVQQFVASEVRWKARELRLRQETDFPRSGKVRLTFSCDRPSDFTLKIRHPHWAEGPLRFRVNGSKVRVASLPGSYASLVGDWHDGDVVEIDLPVRLRTEAMPDNPRRVAVLWGPVVLAGDVGPAGGADQVPVMVVGDRPVTDWVRRADEADLRFLTRKAGRPHEISLIPFYALHGRRHAVYWDLYSKAEWREREAELAVERERQRQIEARMVDVVRIGEMQPERDHNLVGERTTAGEAMGRKWRHATDGGWFAFDVAVVPDAAQELVVTYWGDDGGGFREFDVEVDGRTLATQRLEHNQPGRFFDQAYALPADWVRGKSKVTVRFQAHPGKWAGGVFGVQVMRVEP